MIVLIRVINNLATAQLAVICLTVAMGLVPRAAAGDEADGAAKDNATTAAIDLSSPSVASVREEFARWLASRSEFPESARTTALELVNGIAVDASADTLLEVTIGAMAAADPVVAQFKAALNRLPIALQDQSAPYQIPALVCPSDDGSFYGANLSLYYGKVLTLSRLYDEADPVLAAINPASTVDPAGLVFYRAIAAQGLLKHSVALENVRLLLAQETKVPERYRATARLMETELAALEEKSLGEIARLMSDSERRLDLARPGEKVQSVQEEIIASLDELIKKLEGQGGGGGGAGGEGGAAEKPAEDSSVKGTTGPGETDPKKFSNESRWGDLPPKAQAEAKNILNRNYPSHYRQAIESYFRKLATRPAPEKNP